MFTRYSVLGIMTVCFAGSPTHAVSADNPCQASVKLVKSERFERDSQNWVFTFNVTSKCASSTGGFEYSFKVNKTETVKSSPTWDAAWKGEPIKDTQNVGKDAMPTNIVIHKDTIWSKKL